jgi:hypothetical protein
VTEYVFWLFSGFWIEVDCIPVEITDHKASGLCQSHRCHDIPELEPA